jgi:Glycosyl hydrolase family 63 C-terminal domain
MLDESEFLSPFGIRSVSAVHREKPHIFRVDDHEHRVDYCPGEGNTYLFGGNSNWRGPIWLPINYLLVEALERYHHFYGDALKVECPVGSGQFLTLGDVAIELARQLGRRSSVPRNRFALCARSKLVRIGAVPRVLPCRYRARM